MQRILAALAILIVLGLGIFSGLRNQQSVGSDDATVQAQITKVAQPTTTPAP
jgi:multidrug resistance efflux pump